MQALKGVSAVIFDRVEPQGGYSCFTGRALKVVSNYSWASSKYYLDIGGHVARSHSYEPRSWSQTAFAILTTPIMIALRILNLTFNGPARSAARAVMQYHLNGCQPIAQVSTTPLFTKPRPIEGSVETALASQRADPIKAIQTSWDALIVKIKSPADWETAPTEQALSNHVELIVNYVWALDTTSPLESGTIRLTFHPFLAYSKALILDTRTPALLLESWDSMAHCLQRNNSPTSIFNRPLADSLATVYRDLCTILRRNHEGWNQDNDIDIPYNSVQTHIPVSVTPDEIIMPSIS